MILLHKYIQIKKNIKVKQNYQRLIEQHLLQFINDLYHHY